MEIQKEKKGGRTMNKKKEKRQKTKKFVRVVFGCLMDTTLKLTLMRTCCRDHQTCAIERMCVCV